MKGAEPSAIIDEVLENERREVELFRTLSERVASPLGKAVFRDYAEKGKDLCRHLETLLTRLEKDEETSSADRGEYRVHTVGVADYDDSEEMLSISLEKALSSFDDLTAIDVAARLVRRTARVVARSLKRMHDPAYREALKAIELAERENFLHLKNIEEYLKDPHAWFREREHHMLDGA
ncbi:MAG TPA: hypothetical protein PLW83_06970 [Deltaproteobacteria bacterium]|nr:hypothetical protein [Deltaproteobacteria bacterium]